MSVLDRLTYGKLPENDDHVVKVKQRRSSLKKSLKRQHEWTESSKGRKWYVKDGDRYRAVLRYKNSVITFSNGNDCFYADTEEEVRQVYKDMCDEVDSGTFDDLLEAHLRSMESSKEQSVK